LEAHVPTVYLICGKITLIWKPFTFSLHCADY